MSPVSDTSEANLANQLYHSHMPNYGWIENEPLEYFLRNVEIELKPYRPSQCYETTWHCQPKMVKL